MTNPYIAPKTEVADITSNNTMHYAGFWRRFGATFVDSLLIIVITLPLLWLLYGNALWEKPPGTMLGLGEIIISYVLPIALILLFWLKYGATPGKMLFKLKIVDANTGNDISTMQAIGRYLGYIPSSLVFMLGFLWIIWDKRKQGWHDKIARTVVLRD